MIRKARWVAAAIAISTTAPGAAYTIDFEDRGPGFANVLTFGDYRISAPVSFWLNTSSGSVALAPAMAVPTALSRVDGGAFTLASAVFFAADSNGLGVPIAFDYVTVGGAMGRFTLQTPEFGPGAAIPATRFTANFGANLTNVTRISWSNGAEFHQIDDLVLNAAGAVPEPGSWALFIVGFGVIGAALRRTGMPLRVTA